MLFAVVLDCDTQVAPTHVEIGDQRATRVADWNLSLRPRQPGIDEQESQPGFPGRLCSCVDQRERPAGAAYSAAAWIALKEIGGMCRIEPGRRGQGIQSGHRLADPVPASNIKSRANRARDRDLAKMDDVICGDPIAADFHAGGCRAVAVQDIDRLIDVDPGGSVKRRRCQSGHHS